MELKTNRIMRFSSLVALIAIVTLSGSLASTPEPQNSTPQRQQNNNSSSLLGATLEPNSQKKQKSILQDCSPQEICVKVDKTCALTDNQTGTIFKLSKITNNSTEFIVPNFTVDGKKKSMVLSLCRGLDPSISCEGKKRNSLFSACLLEGLLDPVPTDEAKIKGRTKDDSRVVGHHLQSRLRYSNKDLYYDSSLLTNENQTQVNSSKIQLGTSIKFFCSEKDDKKPKFISFANNTYNFSWGSKLMCPENLKNHTNPTLVSEASKLSNAALSTNGTDSNNGTKLSTTEAPAKSPNITPITQNSNETKTTPEFSDSELKIKPDETPKSAEGKHQLTINDSTKMNGFQTATENVSNNNEAIQSDQKAPQDFNNNINSNPHLTPQPHPEKENNASEPPAPIKMGRFHKFLMISLIIISLASFIVVIFILDNKTRLRLPLNNIRRRARQAFQPQPVPYSRVDAFNDSLDL